MFILAPLAGLILFPPMLIWDLWIYRGKAGGERRRKFAVLGNTLTLTLIGGATAQFLLPRLLLPYAIVEIGTLGGVVGGAYLGYQSTQRAFRGNRRAILVPIALLTLALLFELSLFALVYSLGHNWHS